MPSDTASGYARFDYYGFAVRNDACSCYAGTDAGGHDRTGGSRCMGARPFRRGADFKNNLGRDKGMPG